MATAAVSQTQHRESTGQQDRLFFSGIALLVLIAVAVGFARTYFLAGVFWAKLPSAVVHVHGALFTLWIALLVAQVSLVASRRTPWHMRLGIAGMVLAPLMVITGFAILIGGIKRRFVPPFVLQIITAQDILILCLFSFLIAWAFLARRDAPTHTTTLSALLGENQHVPLRMATYRWRSILHSRGRRGRLGAAAPRLRAGPGTQGESQDAP